MNQVIDGASVIAITEFVKRIAARFGFVLAGEIVIILGAVVGGVLAFLQNTDPLQGALVGSAAVGVHTTASAVGK